MKKLRHFIGWVLAAAGAVAFVYSLLIIIENGTCGDVGQPVCPASSGEGAGVLTGAIFVVIIACFFAGRWGIAVIGLSGGVTAYVYGATHSSQSSTGPLVTGIVFVFIFLFGLLAGWGIQSAATTAETENFKKRAVRTVGRITSVGETGVTVNDNPRVRLVVSYVRADGATATGERKLLVSRLAIPRAGDPVTVWYVPDSDEVRVELGTPDADEPFEGLAAADKRFVDAVPVGWAPAARTTVAPPSGGLAESLARVAELHRDGALTDEEFLRAKQQLLGGA